MKNTVLFAVVFLGLSMASILGCRNTANGIKDDTQNAVHKTGEEMKKGGDKLADAGSGN